MPVNIETYGGRLRLRWRYERQRFCFALGLDDTPTNHAIARLKAADIERDIEYQMFDPTLAKYRGEQISHGGAKVWELFSKYIEYKQSRIRKQTLTKYYGLLTSLKGFFRDRLANRLTDDDCQKFKQHLADRLVSTTLKEQLTLLTAAWDWAAVRKMTNFNPWKGLAQQVPRSSVKPPQPFSLDEIRAILQAFRTHSYYSFYTDYVEFLLGSGCRIGEAIALTWGDVSADCSQIWFGKSFYRGDEKELKAGEAGYVPLSRSLTQMLLKRRPENTETTALVFPAPKGGHIDDANFRNRPWKHVLEDAGVPYRKPYTSRKTLISYWLSQGEDPLVVAKFTRTSVRMIYRHYAGYIPSKAALPDVLGDVFAPSDTTSTGM